MTDEPTELLPSRKLRLIKGAFRFLSPPIAAVLVRDVRKAKEPVLAPALHLTEVMAWLAQAQDVCPGGGVSAGYSMLEGWLPPYPETTGYIIPSFFDYAAHSQRAEFAERAIRLAEWEIKVQMPSGGTQGGLYYGKLGRSESVFNTGQVILGWCRAFRETQDVRFLDAALRAARWLTSVQDADGAWRSHSPLTGTKVHTYNSRTAWSLLEVSVLTDENSFSEAAKRHLNWVMGEQHDNGWIARTEFYVHDHPWGLAFTHTIAYVLEGLLESWRITRCDRYLRACTTAALRLREAYETHKHMPGDFCDDWSTKADYACLTGSAQIAGIWMTLGAALNDPEYASAASALLCDIKATQRLSSSDIGIRGGIQGSSPISGRYTPYLYPNWAAKFFADATMRELKTAL